MANKSDDAELLDAAVYMRMSTDEQVTSIKIQTDGITNKFARNFNIIRWY